jgi:hypothetical protein
VRRLGNPNFGQPQMLTTALRPEVQTGWHVRPNNWETQFSVQRELVPAVSGYAATAAVVRQPVQATQN